MESSWLFETRWAFTSGKIAANNPPFQFDIAHPFIDLMAAFSNTR
jgi:hypothetical protein